ncbi:hypothetical protein [Nonomuraea zeae]|uniref:t-SNARE coiled-coil homology domain-containing protein n=1 Tax=Nonomuraea zeae TaxID=1642303 RepID=A0A5S4G1Q7_9ACTN|nr:hypothetical protein [Nonomuraea zeae]TMR26782.1 hypothetical protein ETD85_41375 [Nonomuraea zeae]
MLDLQEKLHDLESRVVALETATVSGMPGHSIAVRFTSLHDRVDIVGRNVLAKIDKVHKETQGRLTKVDDRLEGVDQRLEGVDERLTGVDQRLEGVDERLTGVDQRLEGVDERLTGVDQHLAGVDQRLVDLNEQILNVREEMSDNFARMELQVDKAYQRLGAHEARFDRIEAFMGQHARQVDERFESVDKEIADLKSILLRIEDKLPA